LNLRLGCSHALRERCEGQFPFVPQHGNTILQGLSRRANIRHIDTHPRVMTRPDLNSDQNGNLSII
jgi:hypothetical protein